MKLQQIVVDHYRSIEHIELSFPTDKPVVLFGPNNAGKSNILSAIDRLLGERYPTYIEMLDSDFYMRDRISYPSSTIQATFTAPYYYDRNRNPYNTVAVTYGYGGDANKHLIHNGQGQQLYISSENRLACQSYLIDAERNIQNAFNYSSKYSILSKFSHKIHKALSSEHKEQLSAAFDEIKTSFEKTTEFSRFFTEFSAALKGSVKGFVHSLAVDFSAYDPNNYARSLRIYVKEGDNIRGFEEFGTGEQQVLLMAFVKAYMQVFSSENFVLIIEEPEAHLHPLAQKWLKEYIVDMCSSGIQVVLSTHSTDFIDAEYLVGLVRVFKENGMTRAVQLTPEKLASFCIESGVPANRINAANVVDFYSTKLFPDQLKGMFAETIILVEGATEYFAIPEFLKRCDYSLAEHGVEIVNCRGKDAIPLFWRLFKAYSFNCYCIFDGDMQEKQNDKLFNGIISSEQWVLVPNEYVVKREYAYFGRDFESYFRASMPEYAEKEQEAIDVYSITSKPGKAKAVAQHCNAVPKFITELKDMLLRIEHHG